MAKDAIDYGRSLYACRMRAVLTPTEAANKLDISRARLSNWENNRGAPSIPNLRRLANLYGTTIDELTKEA